MAKFSRASFVRKAGRETRDSEVPNKESRLDRSLRHGRARFSRTYFFSVNHRHMLAPWHEDGVGGIAPVAFKKMSSETSPQHPIAGAAALALPPQRYQYHQYMSEPSLQHISSGPTLTGLFACYYFSELLMEQMNRPDLRQHSPACCNNAGM